MSGWTFSPDIVAATLAFAGLYITGWNSRRGRAGAASAWRHASFFAGLAALFAALQSPLDALAEHSFALHQVQHLLLRGVGPMLLFLAVPQPLILAGSPRLLREHALGPILRSRWPRRLFALFTHPFAATGWLIAVPVFWQWPSVHNAALLDGPLHYVMHVTMLASALVFFWRVLDARPPPLGASFGARVLMCWAAIAGTIPLGAFLTLKSAVLYGAYGQTGRPWSLAALQDEQLGGLVIWIPGSMMFVVLLLIVIRLWGAREEKAENLRARGIAAGPAPRQLAAANRATALRLAAIAALMVVGVVSAGLLSHLLP